MKQCFILRTHLWDEVNKRLAEQYCQDLFNYCDFIVCLNVKDKSNLNIISNWLQFCNDNNIKLCLMCESDIYRDYPHYKGVWLHSQNTFIYCYQKLAQYDYYWFVEYDLRFTGSIKEVLMDHEFYIHDLLGTHIEDYNSSKEWYWWNEQNINLDIELKNRYKYFPAISRLSYRLLNKLSIDAKITYSVIESYVPTICVKYFGINSLHNLDTKFWTSNTVRYSPIHGNDNFYQQSIKNDNYNLLFHPIKG